MTAKERVLTIRLSGSIQNHREYADRIGVSIIEKKQSVKNQAGEKEKLLLKYGEG